MHPLLDLFSDVPDPRINRTKRHALVDIIVIAVLGIICGADTWVDIEHFGRAKETWLRRFLTLENGIPSHDTFGRVFARLEPDALHERFTVWLKRIAGRLAPQHIAIDGKTVNGAKRDGQRRSKIHLVNAWACESRLVLGQVLTDEKSNEITAVPELLHLLDLQGCVVTLDALGTQKAIAAQIIAQQGDYILPLKGNHPHFHKLIENTLEQLDDHRFAHAFTEQEDAAHDRDERRRLWRLELKDLNGSWSAEEKVEASQWSGLQSLFFLESERQVLGESKEFRRRYFLCSFCPSASEALGFVRGHWGIENRLHWRLDVAFDEDGSRVRTGHAPQNMALLRKMALNLLNQHPSKGSIKSKRLKAGWKEDFLVSLITHAAGPAP